MRRLLALCMLLGACATTGANGQGDLDLPTTGVGPFRKLDPEEVRGVAPFVLDAEDALFREPAVLVDGADVLLYAVARVTAGGASHDAIVRSRASDGRSFFGTTSDIGHHPAQVLAADLPWEGTDVSGPFALRAAGGEVLLFYAAAGKIGLARSTDGLVFTKTPSPILSPDPASTWEDGTLRAPAAYVLPDGRIRLLYASGRAIGEAESKDGGATFARLGPAPAIEPSAEPAPGSLAPNEKPPFDTAAVGDPCPTTRVTPAGRLQVRVLYTGVDDAGGTSVGFASRYGDGAEPMSRQTLPVYAVGQGERAPAYVERAENGGSTMLYVQQNRRVSDKESYAAIAAGYAPAQLHLPEPADFPDSP